jgi:predicted porin
MPGPTRESDTLYARTRMTSLKKLIAVLAISLPLAAMAQQAAAPAAEKPPLAQIYGTLNLNLQNIGTVGSPHGANLAETNVQSRWAVSADSTNIGVKGTAAVSSGFSVVYQCESDAKLDGTGTNVLCTRNSRVGLTHPTYGTLFYGNWDSPFKALYYGTKADDPFGSTDVFGANNIMGSPGFRTLSGGTTGFDIRRTNSVAYWTPKIMGLSGRAQVGVNEGADARYYGGTVGTGAAAGETAKQLNPWLLSAAANYDDGPLSVGIAYEQHRDFQAIQAIQFTSNAMFGAALVPALPATAANWSTRDEAWRISAGYEVPLPVGPLTVAAVVENLKYTQRNTGFGQIKELSRPALGLSAKQRYGDHEFRGRFNWANKVRVKLSDLANGTNPNADAFTTGTDAHEVTLGYAYYLAASTQVYLFYTKIVNGLHASYVPGAGGSLSGAPAVVGGGTTAPGGTVPGTPIAGADPEAYGLGIRYAF